MTTNQWLNSVWDLRALVCNLINIRLVWYVKQIKLVKPLTQPFRYENYGNLPFKTDFG